jgi:2-aminoadipate transaminase
VDGYVGRYAARARDMAASEIRALFAVAARPAIVSLAGGMPCVTALPLDVLGDMTGHLVARRGRAGRGRGAASAPCAAICSARLP